jgi:signal transduction histidine kinase
MASMAMLALPAAGQELVRTAAAAVAAAEPGSAAQLAAKLRQAKVLLRFDDRAGRTALAETLALARQRGDVATTAAALLLQARSAAKVDGLGRALESLGEAESLLPKGQGPAASLHYTHALVHWTFDEVPESLARLRSCIEAAEAAGDERIGALAELMVLNVIGFGDDSLATLDRIEATMLRHDERHGWLEARLLRSAAQRWLGRVAESRATLQKLLGDATTAGDRLIEALAAHTLAVECSTRDRKTSTRLAARALAAANQLGDLEVIGFAHHLQAMSFAQDQELGKAQQSIDAALAAFAQLGLSSRQHGALETAVRIASLADDHVAIADYARRLEALEAAANDRSQGNDRARYWHETGALRGEMKAIQERHAAALADAEARLRHLLLGAGLAALGLVGGLCVLLWRERRSLATANQSLRAEQQETARLVAEREAMTANLQQLERLDGIGLLAGGFAHDFNNLLVGIKGNVQLLLADPNLPAESFQRELLQCVQAAGDRAAGLCKDILAYARPGGRGERQRVDVRRLVTDLLPMARSGFGPGIELETDLGGTELPILADHVQVEQLVLNLLLNAHEAIVARGENPASGRITVRSRRVWLDGSAPTGHWFGELPRQPAEYVCITIADTGEGMTPETIRRIFDPFFSTRLPGRGIGLATAFGILRRHGGVVAVQSERGRGSVFVVHLPLAAAEASADSAPIVTLPNAPRPTPLAPLTILVVDDEPTVRDVVERTLRKQRHRVVLAATGEAALDAWARSEVPIDVAVVDFTMPGMDGGALCAELRRRDPELPIVMISGHDAAMVQANAPACVFLPKPFDGDELLQAIGRAGANRVPSVV